MKKPSLVKSLISLTLIALSIACCMLPKTYKGSIEQKQQEGIIIFKEGVQDLILKVDPKITGKAKLDNFCWLITVPNEPDKYDILEQSIFRSFYKLKRKHLIKPEPRNRGIGCSEKSQLETKSVEAAYDGVELGLYVEVGDYAIQPVRGIGVHAFSGLNQWLEDNGFPTEPQEHMQYFIDKKFTFLCIKIKTGNETDSDEFSPQLKPLHMTFKSERPYYPMKYSSQQGNFSVNIYSVTEKPIDYKTSNPVLKKIDWQDSNLFKNVNLAKKFIPRDLKEILGKDNEYLYFNNFNCRQPNLNKAISRWSEDVFFNLNNSHSPNSSNMMTQRKISWTRTILLIMGILVFLAVAKIKWNKNYTT